MEGSAVTVRAGRLRMLVVVLCVVGVGVAAVDTKAGAYPLLGLLAVLLVIGIAQWLTAPEEDADA